MRFESVLEPKLEGGVRGVDFGRYWLARGLEEGGHFWLDLGFLGCFLVEMVDLSFDLGESGGQK